MLSTILAGVALSLVLPQQGDTTFAVREGMRLEVRNQAGEIRVTAWNRNEVRISAGPAEGVLFDVEQSGSVIRVRPERGRWRDRGDGRRWEWDDGDDEADIRISAPAYLAVSLRGTETEMSVSGIQADINVETVEGAIDVTGGNGFIRLHSVEETITLRDAAGRVEVSSADGDIRLTNINGEITVEAIDGEVELRGIDSRSVTITSVDGDLTYEGTIHDDGRYRLSTHDGDVLLHVPSTANATVTVASYDGDFETSFPIVLRESRRRRFSFTVGTGRAEIHLEAFDGDIYLRRE